MYAERLDCNDGRDRDRDTALVLGDLRRASVVVTIKMDWVLYLRAHSLM